MNCRRLPEDHLVGGETRSVRPLRVLHIGKFYPPHMGGMETHVQALAARQRREASVHVMVSNDAARTEVSELDGVCVTRVARVATIASMPICPALPSLIARTPADVVHIHLPNPWAALSFLLSGHKGKLVVTHHADTMRRKTLRRLSDPFVSRLMHRAKFIIGTSARYVETSSELIPFREKCRIVPLAIECQAPRRQDAALAAKIAQEFGHRLILAVGRLVPYKGLDVLIRAMKEVDGRLLIIGEGPQARVLRDLARTENVMDKVVILGRVDGVAPYLRAASVFALPSITRAEAFGLVQLEAMSAGIPVVNTDLDTGVPGVSLDGVSGFTVPPGDPMALARAITLLLDDDKLRARFGQAGIARAKLEFSVDTMACRTMQIYKEALVDDTL